MEQDFLTIVCTTFFNGFSLTSKKIELQDLHTYPAILPLWNSEL